MKRTVKLAFALALIVLANISVASTMDDFFQVEVTGKRTFNLVIKNISGEGHLEIRGAGGSVLYDLDIDKKMIDKRFDVSAFPAGDYELTFRDNYKIHSVTMHASGDLKFDLESAVIHYVPSIQLRGKSLSVGVLANPSDEMTVSIYDELNQLIIRRKITGSEFIGKSFDFSKAPAGRYRVQVKNQGNLFTEYVKI